MKHETYAQIFGGVYVGLMTNLLLLVACLPVVVLLVTTDPTRSWPLLALVAPALGPALVAAFAVFGAFSTSGDTSVVRTFVRSWRASWRRATAVAGLASVVVVVLAVDVRAVWETRLGAVAIPVFVTLGVLTVATALLALVGAPDRPDVRLRDLLGAAAFVAVRRWYLTAGSLLVLLLQASLVAARPAVGLGLAAAPLLYVVWANSRFALRPVLRPVLASVG